MTTLLLGILVFVICFILYVIGNDFTKAFAGIVVALYGLGLAIYGMIYWGIICGVFNIVNNWDTNTWMIICGVLQILLCKVFALPGIILFYMGNLMVENID